MVSKFDDKTASHTVSDRWARCGLTLGLDSVHENRSDNTHTISYFIFFIGFENESGRGHGFQVRHRSKCLVPFPSTPWHHFFTPNLTARNLSQHRRLAVRFSCGITRLLSLPVGHRASLATASTVACLIKGKRSTMGLMEMRTLNDRAAGENCFDQNCGRRYKRERERVAGAASRPVTRQSSVTRRPALCFAFWPTLAAAPGRAPRKIRVRRT